MKRLEDIGEDAVVATLIKGLPSRPDVRVGAGDDCAVLGRPRDEWWQLLKTDVVVEGVHFLSSEKPARVGWKALCRAISDIAAMGGLPEHAVITLAARADVAVLWVEQLYAGLRRAAKKFGVAIVGGETSRSPGPIFINVALTGRVERRRCVLRSGGRVGDILLVTGRLGGSLRGKHLDFIPRLQEARWLVENFKLSAMMDISDGLAADLPRLARQSQCSYELWHEKIPRTRGCSVAQALSDGEDFELVFALPRTELARLLREWPGRFPKVPITQIGQLIRGTPPPLDFMHSSVSHQDGYHHFA